MANQRIFLSVPHMSGGEQRYIEEAFRSNWLSTVGPNLDAFEAAFGERIGRSCVALSSGTAAIHLGLRLLGVGAGDEVFCPTLTFAATCNPVLYLGARPVLLDSETATWNLDANVLEEALREKAAAGRLPRAVVVVHLYGQCAEMRPILDLCRRYEVPLLEDAAQALGATYRGEQAGTFGDVAAFSFNGNKIITTTGGGMLAARDAEWTAKARFWSQQARDAGVTYEHSQLGYNYRMSNVLAGIGRGQLEVLDLRVRQRRAIAFRYRDAFADVPGIGLMPQAAHGTHTNWLSTFLIDEKAFGCSRDELIAKLEQANVESRPVWKPMHLQPLFAGCARYGGAVAEELFRRGICLPSSSSLSDEEQLRVINTVRAAAGAGMLERIAGDVERGAGESDRGGATIVFRGRVGGVKGDGEEAWAEKLLGRRPAVFSPVDAGHGIEGRVVLVTGAAGSIGSELCRQIARHGPAGIVAFDMDESGLFEAELAIRRAYPSLAYFAELGSIQNAARLEEVFARYRPAVVYHAAAYKHVPMLEGHVVEAVENNVLGTQKVAAAAAAHGAKEFVLISSDKAVRPLSVMGATKRAAERILQAAGGEMRSTIVRFGNVLGSRGSVVPVFEQQIACGGPVTVTDPEMKRFFMTLPEACQLVLQAAALGGDAQIYVLEMGEPVKIVDLAARMIEMAGLRPGVDIGIEFTGARAGEKLAEELWASLEDAVATEREGIFVIAADRDGRLDVESALEELREACAERDEQRAIGVLARMAPQYRPSELVRGRMRAANAAVSGAE